MRQFVTFFKNTLIEVSKFLCRRINGTLFLLELPLMALHYQTAVPPSSSYTFLLALPRLWSISSFSLLSPPSLHSSASHPKLLSKSIWLFAACACDGPVGSLVLPGQLRGQTAQIPAELSCPPHWATLLWICPLPRHKFHKAFRKLLSSRCLPSCQTGLQLIKNLDRQGNCTRHNS